MPPALPVSSVAVAFRVGQQELWCQRDRLKQAAALSDGAVKQAFREGRGHQDAD